MEQFIQLILQAGKTTIDLALYVLLPVLVVMMALMKVLEAKGVVGIVSKLLAPIMNRFGIPGLGVFAALQLLFIGFAAPIASLRLMETNGTCRRGIAATLAMVLAMSQANVVFPMAALGVDIGGMLLLSCVGGLVAASSTYYFFTRNLNSEPVSGKLEIDRDSKSKIFNLMVSGGQEAVDIVVKSIPIILIAIFIVNLVKFVGVIGAVEPLVTPLFSVFGLSSSAVILIFTKFMAGGTAMLGVAMGLLQDGVVTVAEVNRLSGLLVNPLDMVGVSILISSGKKTASVVLPALGGACLGVLVRAVLHLMIY